jgi:cytochrome c
MKNQTRLNVKHNLAPAYSLKGFLLAACTLALAAALAACGASGGAGDNANAAASPAASAGGQAEQKQPEQKKGERGTPEEAKAMLQKAVEHYNSVGRTQALADFNGKKPPFFDRDLYVACMDSKHVLVANGGYPQLVGTSADAWRDADGKAMGKAVSDVASSKGEGSVEYRWYNPVSGKIEPKVGFVQKVGDDILLVGAYNPK